MIKTLEWTDAGVRLIDQTKLPTEETYVTCTSYEEVAEAIKTMIVRGAPAIGVTAAMGVALGVRDSQARDHAELKRDFDHICEVLAATRPTAVNLFWAIRRMRDKFEHVSTQPIPRIQQELVTEAQRMLVEDIAANEAMGRHGAVLLPSSGGVLTHCNAGALATCGYGTALGVIRAAVEAGIPVRVVNTDGAQLIAVQRDDLDLLTDPRAKATRRSFRRAGNSTITSRSVSPTSTPGSPSCAARASRFWKGLISSATRGRS